MQTTTNTTAANLFTQAAATMPTAVCVTAFIAPQAYLEMIAGEAVAYPQTISVGTYMSDRSIWHICNFGNAANALNYAFMLKGENCPISKHAFALLQAEIKRTGAVSTRAQKAAEAKAEKEAEATKEEVAQAEAAPQVEDVKAEKPKRISRKVSDTPLMQQYREMKKKHPDAVLLFRVGDFYETFGEDAVICAEVLKITLTRRANGKDNYIELAGFPHHALDTYLPKLVRAGKRVAICEQLEEPKKRKKATAEAE